MREQEVMINGEICGVLTRPESTAITNSSVPGVLLLHGFATNKNEVNNTNQQVAEKLAAQGIVTLRIDFRGYGDSVGKPEDFSVQDMVDDAEAAYGFLVKVPEVNLDKIGMIGFSLGAAVALLTAKKVQCHSLGLLSPALNLLNDFTLFLGIDTIQRLSRCKDSIEITLPWRTIRIGHIFYQSLCDSSPLAAAETFRGDLFCMAGSKDFSAENVISIDRASPSKNKQKVIIPDADHVFNIEDRTVIFDVIQDISNWMSSVLESNSALSLKL